MGDDKVGEIASEPRAEPELFFFFSSSPKEKIASELSGLAALIMIRANLSGCRHSWFALYSSGGLLLCVLAENSSTSLFASE